MLKEKPYKEEDENCVYTYIPPSPSSQQQAGLIQEQLLLSFLKDWSSVKVSFSEVKKNKNKKVDCTDICSSQSVLELSPLL